MLVRLAIGLVLLVLAKVTARRRDSVLRSSVAVAQHRRTEAINSKFQKVRFKIKNIKQPIKTKHTQ